MPCTLDRVSQCTPAQWNEVPLQLCAALHAVPVANMHMVLLCALLLQRACSLPMQRALASLGTTVACSTHPASTRPQDQLKLLPQQQRRLELLLLVLLCLLPLAGSYRETSCRSSRSSRSWAHMSASLTLTRPAAAGQCLYWSCRTPA